MIYLDHAATSHPKPPSVVAAVERWFRTVGVSPARGDGSLCDAAARAVAEARTAAAGLCGVPAHRLAFTSGATEAINLFLRGFLRRGDAVLTTAAEHSSVARPLRALVDDLDLRLQVTPVGADGAVDAGEVESALDRLQPRLLVFSHASNVTGVVQDAPRLCAAAAARGTTTLLDACQTAGLLPLAAAGADALVTSCHKSLLAPPGLGWLAMREGIEVRPAKQGGTGSSIALDVQPDRWPEMLEAGTPNTPAIFGLGAALDWIAARGSAALLAHGLAVVEALIGELREALGTRLHVHGATAGKPRVPVLSVTIDGLDPAEAGMLLDSDGIFARTGFHCAPWIHDHLGTADAGTIRLSPGPFVSADVAPRVARALAR